MLVWMIGIAVGVAVLFVLGWAFKSVMPSNLRAADPGLAEDLDQMPATLRNPVALPMHDHSFDKPR
jgi:hypothetical protein